MAVPSTTEAKTSEKSLAGPARFKKLIATDSRIESTDWVPAADRKSLVRQISQQAYSEIIGMHLEGNWIVRTPILEPRAMLMAKVQDEAKHGLYLDSAAQTLGTDQGITLEQRISGKAKYRSIFNYPTPTWADMRSIGGLVDGAAICKKVPRWRASYDPYRRAMVRTCKAGSFHQRQGFETLLALMDGSDEQRAMSQESVKPWYAPALMMIGPSDDDSLNSRQSMDRKVKRFSKDDLRQRFVEMLMSQAEVLGLTLRDRAIRWNEERGHYDFGDLDWTEFYDVLAGNGQASAVRVAERNATHDNAAWFREAARAYADKKIAEAELAMAS